MSAAPGVPTIRLSQDPEADALLARSPFALLIAMVLDRQVATERALSGPAVIAERIGRELDPVEVAEYDPEQFAAVLSQPPAVHPLAVAMAGRIQKLAAYVTATYGGDVTRMWSDRSTGAEVLGRFEQLPGFRRVRAKILLALLGKQFGVTPIGWREAAAPYGEDGALLSLADVVDQPSLDAVRSAKRERKLARKQAAGRVDPSSNAETTSVARGGTAYNETARNETARDVTVGDETVGNETPPGHVAKPPDAPRRTMSHVVAGSGVTGVRTPT